MKNSISNCVDDDDDDDGIGVVDDDDGDHRHNDGNGHHRVVYKLFSFRSLCRHDINGTMQSKAAKCVFH